MKTVSEEYAESMAKPMRNRSYIKATMFIEDPSAVDDGEWKDNGALSYSEYDTVDYPYSYGSSYATLEMNRWLLDGKQKIMPGSASSYTPQGFHSALMSDKNGNFSIKPKISRMFEIDHPLHGISVTFDSRCEEWPTSITVNFYVGGAVVDTKTVTVTEEMVVVTTDRDTVDGVDLIFNTMLPYRRPRVEYVLFGLQMVYGSAAISSVTQEHDVDPLTRRLPQERVTVELMDYEGLYAEDNPLGFFRYVEDKARMRVQHGYTLPGGAVEWLEPDNYLLDGKPVSANDRASFSASGVINTLTDKYYKSKVGTKNLYDMAVDVLKDANLTPTATGGEPWVIDEALKRMYTEAVLPLDTHANCLQLIAHAAGCSLRTDGENVVRMERFQLGAARGKAPAGTVDFDTITEKSLVGSKTAKLKAVTVAVYAYNKAESATKLYEGTTEETTLHAELSDAATDLTIEVVGGSVVSKTVYGRAVDMVLTAGTKTVVINGYPLEQSSSIYTLKVNSTGDTDNEVNPLITNTAMAQDLAQHTAEYLALRNTYDLEYRGNPEIETGDAVTLQTNYNPAQQALVLTNSLTFNGGLSGALKVKGLN